MKSLRSSAASAPVPSTTSSSSPPIWSAPRRAKACAIATFPSPPSFGSCANDLLRTGPSAKLPDCRAYEQATPTDKFGSDAYGTPYSVQASNSGDGITFYTFANFPGAEGFQEVNVLHSRFAGGEWSTAGLNTPPSYGDEVYVLAWTPDLRLSFTAASATAEASAPSLVMRDSADGSRTVLIPQGVGFYSGRIQARRGVRQRLEGRLHVDR